MVPRRLRHLAVVTLAAAVWHTTSAAQVSADPFAFFRPSVIVSAADRTRLDRGNTLVRVLAKQDRELAVFAAVSVRAGPDRLLEWVRDIAAFKRSSYVLAIRRFSDPPRLSDLDELSLDDEDLRDIPQCRPGDCALKLGADELTALQGAASDADPLWQARVQDAFRLIVLHRVQAYLQSGQTALPDSADGHAPASLQAGFAGILKHSPALTQNLPALSDYLARYPAAPMPEVESFLYWSKERLAGKPVVSVTHVAILHGAPETGLDVLVAGKQVFATHYMTGSLNLTALVHGAGDAPHYLAYLNRSQVDVLGGLFGGLARSIMEERVESEASQVMLGLRQRLESGPPRPPDVRP